MTVGQRLYEDLVPESARASIESWFMMLARWGEVLVRALRQVLTTPAPRHPLQLRLPGM